MDSKKIDKLFQQLNNLEVTPNEKVWNNIEGNLKKKKRKVFPFWWFSGSVAAILILSLLFFPSSDSEVITNKNTNELIITKTPEKEKINNNLIDGKNEHINSQRKEKNNILISKKEENSVEKENLPIVKEQNSINFSKKNYANYIMLNQIDFQIHAKSLKSDELLLFPKLLAQKTDNNNIDFNSVIEKKEDSKPKNNKNWSIAPVFAVLQSNSFTESSPIDTNLANSTKGENSYSYGVQIAYQINEKWTIQSGVHLQEMRYSNNGVAVFISNRNSSSTVNFTDGNSTSFDETFIQNLSLDSNSISNAIGSGSTLTQNFGYIEIPLEVKYNFFNKKRFSSHLVTGFSSLFLNANDINLTSQSLNRKGESNNLNTINFSGNLGLDFNYLFNQNWSLHLNPMLKVQLNTFDANSNGFAPYNIGVYTGIRYQF
ncbi:outer membrane beta-barrel protein [Polaribacter porphyrae]|uniref:Outer membrane protein beta-barrel domain-containing protein n=1 Tax=Polaribacter porphyrae TaxID=1137780 RepID=A0A2S7WQX3_9FLAO|nr:outer membrane beta-barrel protein [Polaribacter porphyrae]PQJ80020.1 hypothetical protein BTO18_12935 [Polaribacter porphyrae]